MGLFKWKNKEYDALVTNAINGINYPPVSINGDHKIYFGYDEIDGYEFLKCNLISTLKVKSTRGCFAIFSNGNEEIEIESETQEISTDHSDTLGLGVTAFVIDLEPKLKSWIESNSVASIHFNFGKKDCEFSEIDHEVFNDNLKFSEEEEEEGE